MAIYTIHGGHAKTGNKYCGAVGFCAESTEDRLIKDAIIKYLIIDGHKAHDCTVDSGISQTNIITQIKKRINSYSGVTANISIHLNAFTKSNADGKTKGSECCVYALGTTDATIGLHICNKLVSLGFTNRGVKQRTDLGVLKGITNGGANILVECYFCDDEDDYRLAKNLGVDAIGKAIAEGIVGHSIIELPKEKDVEIRIPELVFEPVLNATPTIQGVQKYLNKYYVQYFGKALVEDGLFGGKSKRALACAFQAELNKLGAELVVDGDFGTKSQDAFIRYVGTLQKGSKGIFVTLWQCLLVGLGYNPKGIDGIAGNGFVNASNQLFKSVKLSQDSQVSGVDVNSIL